jgi:DNA-binding transcriptional MocR family regulator
VFWRGGARAPREWFRLGYASIPLERIDAGVAELARAFADAAAR